MPGLAMRCTIVAPGDVCPWRERRFAGPGDLMRGVRTICFIPSLPQQPIFSPRFRAVWFVNVKTQAAAGCFWTVPTPARDGGAAWRTAATEIRPGTTTGARPVDLAVAIIGLGRDWQGQRSSLVVEIRSHMRVYLRNEFKNKHKSTWCQSLNFGRIRAALNYLSEHKLDKLVSSKCGMVRLASSQHRTSPS